MTLHRAERVVIITEKIIAKGVCKILDESGATGYTVVAAGGKGSHSVRATSDRASVIEDFAGVRIEAIVNDKATAEVIMTSVAETYFQNYSGVTYVEAVEILRPHKFTT